MGPQRLRKTRNRTRDLDQISSDLLHPRHLEQHLSSLPLEELPALGQLYCAPCARFLESSHALAHHRRSKTHKKRVKLLKEPAYSHREANAAVGLGVDNGAGIAVGVNPEDVVKSVSRDRILAMKKSNNNNTPTSLSGEMDIEVEHHHDIPNLVEQAPYEEDDENDL